MNMIGLVRFCDAVLLPSRSAAASNVTTRRGHEFSSYKKCSVRTSRGISIGAKCQVVKEGGRVELRINICMVEIQLFLIFQT